jgi:hypothetical protein
MDTSRIPPSRGLEQLPSETVSGIYFLWRGSQLIYVGQSRHIAQRVGQHIEEGRKPFDGMSFIRVEISHLNHVERLYIERFLPQYNRCAMSKARRKLKVLGCKPDEWITPDEAAKIIGLISCADLDLFRDVGLVRKRAPRRREVRYLRRTAEELADIFTQHSFSPAPDQQA